jgi:3-methyladenine DNA glycosylase AlkD
MNPIIQQIRQDLTANVDQHTTETAQHYFKEDIKVYGVKTATVGKVAKKYWAQAKTLPKQEIFDLCEELYRSGYMEEAFIVSNWMPEYIKHLEVADLAVFKRWIDAYVSNWAECDGFCNHTIGDLIDKYPEIVPEVKSWAYSQNRWMKRAAAVSFIIPAKHGEYLKDSLEICDVLLLDGDDMVQKGYGWLLKEESRMHTKEVYDYVVKHRNEMPRTALRYAIELMPKELKAEAMKRD